MRFSWIGSVFLLTIAFIIFPAGWSWFETPKVFFSWAFLLLYGGYVVFASHFWEQRRTISRGVWLLFGLAVLTLSTFITSPSTATFFGNVFRHQGVLMALLLLGLAYRAPLFAREQDLSTFAPWALGATVIGAFLLGPDDGGERLIGTLGEPNALGAYAVFLFAFARAAKGQHAWKTHLFSFLASGCVVLLSGSRSALVAFVLVALLYEVSKRLGTLTAVLAASSLLFLAVFLPFIDTHQGFDQRQEIWRVALSAGWQKPILGWGVGNIEQGLRSRALSLGSPLSFVAVDSSHNIILDWWVQGGVVGAGLFVVTLFLAFRGLYLRRNIPMLAALLVMCTMAFFNPLSVVGLIHLWWLVGVGVWGEGIEKPSMSKLTSEYIA